MPFQGMASTSGFYTSGEFLRYDKRLIQHNVTLVVAAMREGSAESKMLPPQNWRKPTKNWLEWLLWIALPTYTTVVKFKRTSGCKPSEKKFRGFAC